jgi:hypothetical protein
MEEFAGLVFGEKARMDDVRSCGHEAPQAAPGIPGTSGSGKHDSERPGKSKRFAARMDLVLKELEKAAESQGILDMGHSLTA